jgi:hypothetical protein
MLRTSFWMRSSFMGLLDLSEEPWVLMFWPSACCLEDSPLACSCHILAAARLSAIHIGSIVKRCSKLGIWKIYHCAGEVSRPGDGLSCFSTWNVVQRAESGGVDFECGLGTPRKLNDVRASAATFRIACRAPFIYPWRRRRVTILRHQLPQHHSQDSKAVLEHARLQTWRHQTSRARW